MVMSTRMAPGGRLAQVRLARVVDQLDGFAVCCGLLAGALATLAWAAGWHGPDLAAQLHRIDVFRTFGFTLWDAQWFGGHYPLAYSVLFPPLGAVLGAGTLGVLCAGISAWAFARLLHVHFGSEVWLGGLWFAAGTAATVMIGQLAFLLGAVVALLVVLSHGSGRRLLAGVLAVLCPLASPVAGALLLLAIAAWWLSTSSPARRPLVVLAALVCCGLAAVRLGFPQGGTFPFAATTFAGVAASSILGIWLLPKREKALRIGAALYGVVGLILFVIPQPMGANLGRLGTAVAGPIAATVLWPRRRLLLVGVAIPLLLWQWVPAVAEAATGHPDPSRQSAYFQPMLGYLVPRVGVQTRVEIPSTRDHWEARWAAAAVPLARGWERQIDNSENALFYTKGGLTAATYQAWLRNNGVGWVAIPDVSLDYAAEKEAQLVASGLPYLQLTYTSAHWKVWKVDGDPGLVDGPGYMVSLGADRFSVAADQVGPLEVKVRYTPYWSVVGASACVSPRPDGWTELQVLQPGLIDVSAQFLSPKPAACASKSEGSASRPGARPLPVGLS
jgi:hypothetical protein